MRRRKRYLAWTGGALLIAALFLIWRSLADETASFPVIPEEELYQKIQTLNSQDISYVQWIRSEAAGALKDTQGVEVRVSAADYSAASPDAELQRRRDDRLAADVVDWNNHKGWLEWQINVPEDGYYQLIVKYASLEGSFSQIVRGIQIDGQFPFKEAERLGLDRLWKDSQYPYERNEINNEIRPVQEEIKDWNEQWISDHTVSPEPLRFALSQGKHTVRLVGVKEPISLHSLAFVSPYRIPAYAEYASQSDAEPSSEAWYAAIEGEQFKRKTASSVRTISISNAFISPNPLGRIVYNAMGGTTWQNPGESVVWEITVPHTGQYALDLKYFQGYNGDATVYRTIKLDGKVPFREMLRYEFAPGTSVQLGTLANGEGNPYLFYLTEGTHELEMTVDNSLIRTAILALYEINERLTDIEQNVRIISGNYGFGGVVNLDTSRVWEMKRYDPEIDVKLVRLRDDLQSISDYLKGLYQNSSGATSALDAAVDRLDRLIDDVNNLPNEVGAFTEIKLSINNWTQTIESQPLYIDQLVVRTPNADPEIRPPGAWGKMKYAMSDFFRTFVQKYDENDYGNDEALTIWVQRNRDYVDLLQAMIDEEFTPRTGIEVNLSLMTSQQTLMMSAAAGRQPDVALGFGMEVPVDYAMRGAAVDLTQFEGFEEVYRRFNPGIMRSYTYDGKVYGLPEAVTYNMLFVRTDILEQLGLEPPDTWEDVIEMLPTLQENTMSFHYPRLANIITSGTSFMPLRSDFITAYYQHGAEFYSPDGLMPQLASDQGYEAFKRWTEWFTKYDLPRDVQEFFNYFRYGWTPVGVGDISTYIQLRIAAPELAGNWMMLPIPGVKQPDGTVERWSSQGVTSALMFEASDKKEKAWAFLDWWTSDDVQSRYGRDIESFAGIAYRWHTANVNAMQTLPWEEEDLLAINEQWRWEKNMPFVPGYYMLPREMDFAWNNAVLSGIPPREALDDAQKAFLREMQRKQLEFGIRPGDDLEIPIYQQPYRKE